MRRTARAMALGAVLLVTSSAASADDWSQAVEVVVGEHSSEFSIYEESRPFIVFGAYGDDEELRAICKGGASVLQGVLAAMVRDLGEGCPELPKARESVKPIVVYLYRDRARFFEETKQDHVRCTGVTNGLQELLTYWTPHDEEGGLRFHGALAIIRWVSGALGSEPRTPGWAEVGLATRYAFAKVKEDGSLDYESGSEEADGLLRYHLEFGIPGAKSLLRRSGLGDFRCRTEDMAINVARAPEWTSSASIQAASLVDTLWKGEGVSTDAFPGYLHDLLGGDVASFVSRFGKLEEVQQRWAKHVAKRISR